MVRTRVGYAGGTLKNPTYHHLGDHTEVIQIDYDPKVTSYEKMLEAFWAWHNPCRKSWSRQYRSVILYQNEAQKRLALETKTRVEKEKGAVYTDVEPLKEFWLAEDYHQKYTLRQHSGFMKELAAIYPDPKDFVNSTVAARLNAFLAGHGSADLIKAELSRYGLSAELNKLLEETVDNR